MGKVEQTNDRKVVRFDEMEIPKWVWWLSAIAFLILLGVLSAFVWSRAIRKKAPDPTLPTTSDRELVLEIAERLAPALGSFDDRSRADRYFRKYVVSLSRTAQPDERSRLIRLQNRLPGFPVNPDYERHFKFQPSPTIREQFERGVLPSAPQPR